MKHDGSQGNVATPLPTSHRAPHRHRSPRRNHTHLILGSILSVVLLVFLSVVGYGVFQYFSLTTGIKRSDVLGKGTVAGETNILIMGLDSRLDEDGNPLPAKIYNALHAGDAADGGMNANVLMLLHLPAGGGKATEISIPRDDYVHLAGCPDGECMGKIKQAYGLAYDQASKILVKKTALSGVQREQEERDAGRKAEIATVTQFLGGVPIDHFVEVTLVAFYQIAQVVQPITVCVNENTSDSYSGANFHKGYQQINASQALAFVRQRRDDLHPSLNFTDLDRERRQQAFIVSLAYKLKQANTFTNPIKLTQILNVAKQNTAVDSGLNLLSFAKQASSLTGGNVTYYTLPIDHFGTDPLGEDVNYVNLPLIQATVAHLLGPASGGGATVAPVAPSSTPAPAHVVVDVVNSSDHGGLGAQLEGALSIRGYKSGTATTATVASSTSSIQYGAGGQASASGLATALGALPTESLASLAPGRLRVVIGEDFTIPAGFAQKPTAKASTVAPASATPVRASGAGAAPPPTALSVLSGGGIRCVK
jgi:LCP family protein required for cell wall assembly